MTNNYSVEIIEAQQEIGDIDYSTPGQLLISNLDIDSTLSESTEISLWELAHYSAVEWWLTDYEPCLSSSNLEKIQGYLEGFHHLCEVNDWGKAKKIFFAEFNKLPSLANLLNIWGLYAEEIEMSNRLLGKLDESLDGVLLNSLGNAYFNLGDHEKSFDYHQKCLLIAQEINDIERVGIALGSLGNVCDAISNYRQAIAYHKQRLVIAQNTRNLQEEGSALGGLGNSYKAIGEYQKAIDCHQRHLHIKENVKDLRGEADALGNLGSVYYEIGDYRRAIDYQHKSLELAQKIGYRQAKGNAIGNLGIAYLILAHHQEAIKYIQESLEIARENRNLREEVNALS